MDMSVTRLLKSWKVLREERPMEMFSSMALILISTFVITHTYYLPSMAKCNYERYRLFIELLNGYSVIIGFSWIVVTLVCGEAKSKWILLCMCLSWIMYSAVFSILSRPLLVVLCLLTFYFVFSAYRRTTKATIFLSEK